VSQSLLEALGEPADCIVTLDFETYFSKEYSLTKLSTEQYVRDPRFEVIGCSVKVADRPAVWLSEEDFRTWVKRVDWSRVAILAHNFAFDGFILSQHYGIVPGFCLDTLSMGRPIHGVEVGGSLKKLAAHYGVGEKGTEILNALGKRRADFTEEEWFRYGEYCRNDTELCRAIFDRMITDGFGEQLLWEIDTTVRAFVDPKFVLDEAMLTEFLEYEKQRKVDLLAKVTADRSVLQSNQKFATLLLEMGEDPPKKVSPKTGKEAFAFAKTDPGMKALLEHERDEIRWLAEARIGVKSTINETRTERFLKMGAGGRPVPVMLKYHGAHTGRWSGADRVNFQNLERASKKNPRKGVLRKALLAPAGQVVVASDSAQIEARVLAWASGHDKLVAAFAQGRDVYSEFASVAYGRHVDRKANPEDEGPGNVGKTCILGLGYGLGWVKLSAAMLAGPMGANPVQFTYSDAEVMGVNPPRPNFLKTLYEYMDSIQPDAPDTDFIDKNKEETDKMKRALPFARSAASIPTRLSKKEIYIHCLVCKHLVDTYREVNAPIVAFWKEMDVILMAMLYGKERRFGPDGVFVTGQNRITLPSGRTLKYPELECDEGGFSFKSRARGDGRERIYGGKLVENIIQAVARDVIAEQMLWIRVDGYPIGTTTHDEVVAFAPEADGPNAVQRMLSRMKAPPQWARGIPLSAEGGFSRSYGLAKK
jgi:hypothetical protein